jgi:hypothetical protein
MKNNYCFCIGKIAIKMMGQKKLYRPSADKINANIRSILVPGHINPTWLKPPQKTQKLG